jgi:hypothetical protein
VIAFAATQLTSDRTLPDTRSNVPAVLPKKEKAAKLPPAAKLVAAEFVKTAVLRQNLDRAWALVAPELKQGFTLKDWRSGNIPVVPFPKKWFQLAPMKVDYAYENKALIEVAMLSKDDKKVKSQNFFLELVKIGKGDAAKWRVSSWVPRGAPKIPLPAS